LGGGRDVAGRIVEQHDRGAGGYGTGDQCLLLVAAAQFENVGAKASVVEPEAAGGGPGRFGLPAARDQAEGAAHGDAADGDVGEHAPQGEHALLLPVAGNVAGRRGAPHIAAGTGAGGVDGGEQVLLAVTLEPGEADDLAGPEAQFAAEGRGEGAADAHYFRTAP